MLFNNHVAEVDPYAESDALVLGGFGIALGHSALDLNGATDGINDAWELSKQTVASILYRMAAVLLQFWLDQIQEMGLTS